MPKPRQTYENKKQPSRVRESFILERAKTLGFTGLSADLLDEILAWAARETPSHSRLLEQFIERLAADRHERRIERRIKESRLPQRKTLETFEWNFQPGVDQAAIEELGELHFVDRGEDILLTGRAGTGKSHILKALALRACQAGHRVHYARCVDLIDELYAGLADGTYRQRLRKLTRVRLLVIDDVGLGQLKRRDEEATAAHLLFNVVDARHEDLSTSTALTSNIKLSAWGKYLGDATLAAAILDRLTGSSIRFEIDGPSYRGHQAEQRALIRAKASSHTSKKLKRKKKSTS